jgi:TonB-dependent receptor
MKFLLTLLLVLPIQLLAQPSETFKKDSVRNVEGVTVTFKINKESTTELVKLQRNSVTSVDGINAETFKRTPDSKVSDVFKRVSGISVVDNKFVVVRGLNDRYNFALLNGLPLPSSESDKRSFSFDIFPSNMIDNLMVMKTASPDLPGEFAGGIIDINTSEPKNENTHTIQIGGSHNTIATFRNFKTYDVESRGLPNINGTIDFQNLSKQERSEVAKLMDFTWSTKDRLALPNPSIQYTLSRNIKLKKKQTLSFILTYNYQNNFNYNNIVRREFEEQATGVVKKMELNDSVFTQSVLNSGMLNLVYKINENNTIKFKNIYSVNSEDKVNVRNGVRELDSDPRQWEKSTNFWYTQNNFLTNQLLGIHTIKENKFNWSVGYSNVKRDIPNLRRVVYRKYSLNEDDPTEQYVAVVQQNGTIPTAAGNMFWSESDEKIISARYDLTIPFKEVNSIKIGGWNQFRMKDFQSRNFGFSQYKPNGSTFNSNLLLLPMDQIFSIENMGLLSNGQGGFKLDEATKVDDSYNANSLLNSFYTMVDYKLDKWRFTGGIRLESYNQNFNYIEFGSNLNRNIDTTVIDLLPSVNIIYNFNKKMKLRGSISQTVSRPEFRELAPFNFYNFILDNITSGNPYLKRTKITNCDIRYEVYPGSGQIISLSGFYKNFDNPIETINRTGTSGAPELYFSNIDRSQSFGGELEFRFKLGFLSKVENHKLWDQLTLYSNVSLIKSVVNMDEVIGAGGNRPLQGQSPYIINSGLFYTNKKEDFNVTLSYNVIGPRIYIVGNQQEPSVWENGRNVIDFQLAKSYKKFEIKLNIKDILAQKLIYFQDLNGNQKYDTEDNRWQEITFGQTVSLSVRYKF